MAGADEKAVAAGEKELGATEEAGMAKAVVVVKVEEEVEVEVEEEMVMVEAVDLMFLTQRNQQKL